MYTSVPNHPAYKSVLEAQFCPYQAQTPAEIQTGAAEHICSCAKGCGVGDICDASHHQYPKSAYKLVMSGIVGPKRSVNAVFGTSFYQQHAGEVYTFLMNVDKIEDYGSSVDGEITTLEHIARLDPTGDFTGHLICHDDIRGVLGTPSQEHLELHTIYRQLLGGVHSGKMTPGMQNVIDFFKTASCATSAGGFPHIKLVYLANAGESLYSLSLDSRSALVSATATINASNKLLVDYHKLADAGICHLDMHSDNIRFIIKQDTSKSFVLNLKMIDFGMNDYYINGEKSDGLSFVNNNFEFRSRRLLGGKSEPPCFRDWHPVQYPLFKISFHMMSRCLSGLAKAGKTHYTEFTDNVDMARMYCCRLVSCAMTGKALVGNSAFTSEPPLNLSDYLKEFGLTCSDLVNFVHGITREYAHMYTLEELLNIWKDVFASVKWAMRQYNTTHPPHLSFMSQMNLFKNAREHPCDYNPDVHCREIYTNSYVFCFEYFCMDFHAFSRIGDNQQRARKKFDEFSICSRMVHLMRHQGKHAVSHHDKHLLKEHILRLKESARLPGVQERSDARVRDAIWLPMNRRNPGQGGGGSKCARV